MKNALKFVSLFMMFAMAAWAAQITVDFSVFGVQDPFNPDPHLLGPQNIMTPAHINASGVGFMYDVDPGGLVTVPTNLGPCQFDAGNGGIQWTPGCVGAHVDSGGVYGTTDGTYDLFFAGASALSFNFLVTTWLNPGTIIDDLNVTANFMLAGTANGSATVLGSDPSVICTQGVGFATCSGQFTYVGRMFDVATITFFPAGSLTTDDLGTPISGTNGYATMNMDTVIYDSVPEPATLALCAAALLGFGSLRKLLRKRS